MTNFGEQQEDNSFEPKKVFLGKRTFRVVAVNPDEAWLKENKIFISPTEFERHGLMQTKNKPEGTQNKFARIDVFIRDAFDPENAELNTIRLSYTIEERAYLNNVGNKAQIINKYGGTLWVDIEEAKTLKISNPYIGESKFVLDDIKIAIPGEEKLVRLIRTLRNMNNVRDETPADERAKLASLFGKADFEKMFKGDFKDIKSLIMHGTPDVGFLLGAKTSDKGNVYQDVFRDEPLRPYQVKTDKNENLFKKVIKAQSDGMYSNTYFDTSDGSYREYAFTDAISPNTGDELLNDSSINNGGGFGSTSNPANSNGGFGTPTGDDPFQMTEVNNTNTDEPDDLPF